MATVIRTRTDRRKIVQVDTGRERRRDDHVCVEEPMEIRLISGDGPDYFSVAVTMRTPGNDFELAVGFLLTEGIVRSRDEIRAISYCGDLVSGVPQISADPKNMTSLGLRHPEERYNVVNVYLNTNVNVDIDRLQRNFYTTSSCGICGKASLEAVRTLGVPAVQDDSQVTPEVLAGLGDRLREAQQVFERTGGLHAAGWFDTQGQLHAVREDVGRHNAVDKLIGHAFLEGPLPMQSSILMVSGRASFEIVQKAAVAGFPIIAAISAPSSLACDVAEEFNITLVGFLRGERFNVYTVPERIAFESPDRAAQSPNRPAETNEQTETHGGDVS